MNRKQTKVNTIPIDGPALFAEERRRLILDRLTQFGKVTVEELAYEYALSSATIRADLSRLESDGALSRTHGGAIARRGTLYEPAYGSREVMRLEEKRAIASDAAKLVRSGETILLDAGTTAHEIAKCLASRTDITVVTNSIPIVTTLMGGGVQLVVVGGHVQSKRQATLGPVAARFLKDFHVDRAFLAFNGVHLDAGFTVIDFDAAEVKRQMMQAAREVVVVADSSKIGQVAFASAARICDARVLITDSGVAESNLDELRRTGLDVRVVAL